VEKEGWEASETCREEPGEGESRTGGGEEEIFGNIVSLLYPKDAHGSFY
jgi:hypothetical protein